jgi:hypothetical protein
MFSSSAAPATKRSGILRPPWLRPASRRWTFSASRPSGACLDDREGVEHADEAIPFRCVACAAANLHVADRGPRELSPNGHRLDD